MSIELTTTRAYSILVSHRIVPSESPIGTSVTSALASAPRLEPLWETRDPPALHSSSSSNLPSGTGHSVCPSLVSREIMRLSELFRVVLLIRSVFTSTISRNPPHLLVTVLVLHIPSQNSPHE